MLNLPQTVVGAWAPSVPDGPETPHVLALAARGQLRSYRRSVVLFAGPLVRLHRVDVVNRARTI